MYNMYNVIIVNLMNDYSHQPETKNGNLAIILNLSFRSVSPPNRYSSWIGHRSDTKVYPRQESADRQARGPANLT